MLNGFQGFKIYNVTKSSLKDILGIIMNRASRSNIVKALVFIHNIKNVHTYLNNNNNHNFIQIL